MPIKFLRSLILAASLFGSSGNLHAAPALFGHSALAGQTLDAEGIKAVLLGKRVTLGGVRVVIVMARNSDAQNAFLQTHLGMTTSQFQNHWRRLFMTGGGTAPKIVETEADARQLAVETPGAIVDHRLRAGRPVSPSSPCSSPPMNLSRFTRNFGFRQTMLLTAGCFALIALGVTVVTVISRNYSRQGTKQTETLTGQFLPGLVTLARLQDAALNLKSITYQFALARDEDAMKRKGRRFRTPRVQVTRSIAQLKLLAHDEPTQRLIAAFAVDVEQLSRECGEISDRAGRRRV